MLLSLAQLESQAQLQSIPFQKDSLGKSYGGLDLPLLTIGPPSRQVILATARVHPGETQSSFVLEGFVKHLLSGEAHPLLQQVTFLIVPMLNPDGVVAGNFRCSFAGRDLNRLFQQPGSTAPEVTAVKKLV
jgi:murein tripeptide amidase MpaA